jgi:hypothetical protein
MAARPRAPVAVAPFFKWLLAINGAVCATCLALMTWVAGTTPDPMPKAKERLLMVCENAVALTVGTFIGLLGGRAAAPDQKSAGRRG